MECKQCTTSFEITDSDRQFYQKIDVPEPTLCPDCRMQRRLAFRAEIKLYKRKSDKSGQSIISMYPSNKPYPIYSVTEWWSDDWNALEYGQDFDFNRPFFEQFFELYNRVPKMANFNAKSENCEFSNIAVNSKNVYYSFMIARSENVYYSRRCTAYNNHLFNCTFCFQSSYLNNCVDCHNCHSSTNLFQCNNSRDAYFSIDCHGCSEIIFCTNLRNKNYCIDNQQFPEEEYLARKKEILNGSYVKNLKNEKYFKEIWLKKPWQHLYMFNCENCTGNNLHNCSNVHSCFDSNNLQNTKYVWEAGPSKIQSNSMDIGTGGIGDWLYDCCGLGGGNYFMRFCFSCRYSGNLTYCVDCFTCNDCFGCTGLNNKKYCIFNKQYAKKEYEELVPKIIEYMCTTSEWGEFFPVSKSPFGYNETLAQEYFPILKEDVLKKGWHWHDEEVKIPHPQTYEIPDTIQDVPDDISKEILACEDCNKNYRVIIQELKFYREMPLPIPRKCPICRMQKRTSLRNPRKLFSRNCSKCQKEIQTTYSPERPEIVYCENCYLAEVY